jgi:hypothetical protein
LAFLTALVVGFIDAPPNALAAPVRFSLPKPDGGNSVTPLNGGSAKKVDVNNEGPNGIEVTVTWADGHHTTSTIARGNGESFTEDGTHGKIATVTISKQGADGSATGSTDVSV